MNPMKILTDPEGVFGEYSNGTELKRSIGKNGIFEQSKINERFFVGDQWHGSHCGKDRPLVRRNLIKRIGEFKMSTVTAAPIAVNYTVDGISLNTVDSTEKKDLRKNLLLGKDCLNGAKNPTATELSLVTQMLSNYFAVTAERVHFDLKKEQVVRNAYLSGTGIAYTWWDTDVQTGLFTDEASKNPIHGDLQLEVLDVENVVFGDPNLDDVQGQPFVIVSQRKNASEVQREARQNHVAESEIAKIVPEPNSRDENAGARGETESRDSGRVTVLTKFFKQWDDETGSFHIMACKVTENCVVRKPFDLKISLYPLAKFSWERRRSCIYGDSEVTYLIPNQIAVNRALSADIWSVMTTGMPITIVNQSLLNKRLTNAPGQILEYTGPTELMGQVIKTVSPPLFSAQMLSAVNTLAANTLADSGANDAALGNVRPDNASAIIQMREAALQPMQLYQNRFYDFVEDLARIFAQFWVHFYGDRKLHLSTPEGDAYVPFHAGRYENLLFHARIDVGASAIWSTSVVVSTLDSLLHSGMISPLQYLERLPDGLIPDKTGLMADLRTQPQTGEPQEPQTKTQQTEERQPSIKQQQLQNRAQSTDTKAQREAVLALFRQQQPRLFAKFQQLTEGQQAELLTRIEPDLLSSESGSQKAQSPSFGKEDL